MNKKILSGLALLLLLITGFSTASQASCWVYTSEDDKDNIESLRYVIRAYNDFTDSYNDCDSYGADVGVYDQAIKFSTEELGYTGYVITDNTITLHSKFSIGNSDLNLVIGNSSSTDGVIIIDARTNSLSKVFSCKSISGIKLITLRNMTILVDDLTWDDVVTNQSCLLAGSNVKVCNSDDGTTNCVTGTSGGGVDADGDGYTIDEDCDDNNAAVNPRASEICDGIDNDCDGLIDSADSGVTGASYWYPDADGDGYYTTGATSVKSCSEPASTTDIKNYVADSSTNPLYDGDCDDSNPDVNPGKKEVCDNEVDENCDGDVRTCEICDNIDSSGNPIDDNEDGYIDCEDPDCTELDVCNGTVETDCTNVDDTGAAIDDDGNGYANCLDSYCLEHEPSCVVTIEADCSDGLDDDENGSTDCEDSACVDSADCDVSSQDLDGDGFSEDDGDCNDEDATVYLGAPEICYTCQNTNDPTTCDTADGIDQNCDGQPDDGCSGSPYVDDDGDGYCEDTIECTDGSTPGDCDDGIEDTNPGAADICEDDIDNNCDGETDETVSCEENVALPSSGCGCDLTARHPQEMSLAIMMLLSMMVLMSVYSVRVRKS